MMAVTDKTTVAGPAFVPETLDEKLVELHDASRHYANLGRKDTAARETVLLSVTRILEHDLQYGERALVADILMALIKQAEVDLRESISERLAGMKDVPGEVVLQLAHDTISVARPVLERSPVLTELDLLYIIRSKTAEYWRAITHRRKLDTVVVDALVKTGDPGTALGLLKNEQVELRPSVLEAFAEYSKYSDMLAEPLLKRRNLPEKVVMELYWHVSNQLREHILKNFDIPKEKLDAALQDALQDFTDASAGVQDPTPSKLMVDIAMQYGRLSRITDGILVKTLRRGQVRFFIALMSERSGLPYHTIHEIMRQIGGQGMAVLAKATGVSKENFVSLFLLSRSFTRGDHAVDALELRKALKYYNALTEDVATTILANTIITGTKH